MSDLQDSLFRHLALIRLTPCAAKSISGPGRVGRHNLIVEVSPSIACRMNAPHLSPEECLEPGWQRLHARPTLTGTHAYQEAS